MHIAIASEGDITIGLGYGLDMGRTATGEREDRHENSTF